MSLALAVEHHLAGRFDQAEAQYRRLLEEGPAEVRAVGLWGALRFQRGDYGGAERLIRAALVALPDWPEYYNNLGETLRRQDLVEEAAALLTRSIRQAPDYALAHHNISLCLRRTGDRTAARRHAVLSMLLAPDHADGSNSPRRIVAPGRTLAAGRKLAAPLSQTAARPCRGNLQFGQSFQ